jgi:hypothetical protein
VILIESNSPQPANSAAITSSSAMARFLLISHTPF